MEVAVETTMSNHTLDQNELRSRRSSKIGDVDTPVELKKLDAHFDNKTTAAHPTANTSHVSEQFGSDEVSVASDEAALGSDDWDYLKKAESSATPSLSESTTPVPEVEGQLANFGIVSTGIYRSAWPAPDSYGFIKDLKLKTVVTLVQREVEDTTYTTFLRTNGIKQYVIDMKGTKKQAIPAEMMMNVLRLVLDESNHPVLVHCNHGRHRTGCVVGVIRRLYGWDTPTILAEYHLYADPKPRGADIAYLTDTEPTSFFKEPTSDHLPRPKTFFRTLIFAFLGTLIWLLTGYEFGNAMGRTS
ncbi:hypothetical protein SAPIO_CDS0924 [Scedosporium apiospermum]|uniref:Tyrosine specific protein phosphatases domain-containing protein n=1 Tax=Pseudallescheria apiosperma TaxID=563466 RepID=A0A084GFG5_PSEDA|nr:uncharacterized protein SAPIO_CDS0924 [Scedosporium apiospermum]KEZ46077.1 hypothetical protein SAPIO_CDS0924 [Scedosporium apiospermum]